MNLFVVWSTSQRTSRCLQVLNQVSGLRCCRQLNRSYTSCVRSPGISDSDIQLDLLGDNNQEMSLENVSQFVEAKEAGEKAASRLLDSHTVDAARISYKKSKQDTSDKCGYCGKIGHGKSASPRTRRTHCPAYCHSCTNCDRYHHFESVCRGKDKPKDKHKATPPTNVDDCGGAVFDLLVLFKKKSIALDHHLHANLLDAWVRQRSKPFINLDVRIISQDYTDLGFNINSKTRDATISAIADTGCQSCLALMFFVDWD